jgi:hypothetical protein
MVDCAVVLAFDDKFCSILGDLANSLTNHSVTAVNFEPLHRRRSLSARDAAGPQCATGQQFRRGRVADFAPLGGAWCCFQLRMCLKGG